MAGDAAEAFDALAEELVDYRIARYLFTKASPLESAMRLKVIQAQGRPILMLDRDRNPGLPQGQATFTADGVVYTGDFVKIALNVAHSEGHPDNGLAELPRSWFGPGAGQPGTAQYVDVIPGEFH